MNVSFRSPSIRFGTANSGVNNNQKELQIVQDRFYSTDALWLLAPFNAKYPNIKNNPQRISEEISKLNQQNKDLNKEISELQTKLNNKTNNQPKMSSKLQKAKEDLAINNVYLTYLNQLKSKTGFDENEIKKAAIALNEVLSEGFENISTPIHFKMEGDFVVLSLNQETGIHPSNNNGDNSLISKLKRYFLK